MPAQEILIVDDEEVVLEMVKEALEFNGYKTRLARNGVEGVIALLDQRESIGFILMDIKMPRLNGVDALRIMRKIAPNIPVITFTGHAESGEMSETVRLGAITCMTKPFKVEELLGTLKKYL
ncbi:MAG: response regulator [Nitrospirota bacterium]|nr:response regulator [Nitrospirota bacterium]